MINLKARSFSAATAPSEHEEQVEFIRLVEFAFPPEVAALLFAIPNGGARHIKTARELKAEGVRKGVPDLFLAYPHNGYSGLFIEMKKRYGGRVSPEQKAYWRSSAIRRCCRTIHNSSPVSTNRQKNAI